MAQYVGSRCGWQTYLGFERCLIFLMVLARSRSITQQRGSRKGDFQSLGSYEGHFVLEMTQTAHVSVVDGHDFGFQVSYNLNYYIINYITAEI